MSWPKDKVKGILDYHEFRKRLYAEFIQKTLYPFAMEGHISIEEAQFLSQLVKEANEIQGPIVEVGTLFGYSTLVMIIAKHPGKTLISVDKFSWNPAALSPEMHYDLAKEILKEAIEKNSTQLLKIDKGEFYEKYSDRSPSLVFFDANHSYEATLEDLLWAKKVKANIVAGHDYSSKHPGVIKAVHEVFTDASLHVYDSLFAIRTRKKEL